MTIHTMTYLDGMKEVDISYVDGKAVIGGYNGTLDEKAYSTPLSFQSWLKGVTKAIERGVMVEYSTVKV